MNEHKKHGSSFSSKMGFILAAAGSAVGLGNLWRFPYLAAKYGGGSFLLIYVILAVTFGFALMITEIALGRKTGKSALYAFSTLHEKCGFIGILASIVPIIILPYYCVIGGWVIKFAWAFLTGSGNAAAADDLLGYCVEKQVPVVLCTTGLSEEQLAKVEESAKKVAVLKSANMSLGINLLLKILQDATKVLSPAGYDIELVEKHHNQKLDAPSGTALALADSINEAADNQYHYVYDRSQVRQKRDGKEIGISALRGGTIVGEHEVIFAGTDEVIEFKHTAYSRSVFGKGAVEAAKFLAGKESGMYDMSDVVGL